MQVVICGVPKTVDNDIPIIDKTFGFDTAVEEACRAIQAADVEANSVEPGVGLVRLMGRNSGFIALNATCASRAVNICLVPEVPYELDGPNGLLNFVRQRLQTRKHCVIVVAEGSATACRDRNLTIQGSDASGNPKLYEIGTYLRDAITDYFKSLDFPMTLKYIDPTYMVRSVAAIGTDKVLCTRLAMGAVHGAFAGYTDFSVGNIGDVECLIPIALLIKLG
mmetsp:Transcript_23091/g.11150  ORF Transcript_23091/g.11150 Transcript_23091/m.11150 type:complete len:222 (-) Transcript_23091:116-781(-)|eukprot:CAMPEP_0201283338 /NCGR_PEP_ID=MMETSP1317-20130820/8302_1 /ASSEMBLY_ACC=CAM_ASM_000770 /TAXON_ID=187299 /ORGANISM="Undescribed Undescribed, Strain Undescribed" /LENGTH=221 /DNA_ID=CAMNT_0047599275 /DNA_START=298 /DNA_END=963 /DNA_ORIENTATION=+